MSRYNGIYIAPAIDYLWRVYDDVVYCTCRIEYSVSQFQLLAVHADGRYSHFLIYHVCRAHIPPDPLCPIYLDSNCGTLKGKQPTGTLLRYWE